MENTDDKYENPDGVNVSVHEAPNVAGPSDLHEDEIEAVSFPSRPGPDTYLHRLRQILASRSESREIIRIFANMNLITEALVNVPICS